MTKLVVHEFNMGDVEDIEIYAAEPIYQWQQTEKGKWVMQHSINPPTWYQGLDPTMYGWRIRIVAEFSDKDLTYYTLKWASV